MTEKVKRYKLKHTDDSVIYHVEVEFEEDGGIHFCGEDAWHQQVHLYPNQVKKFKKVMNRLLEAKE